nr:MAG TPA: hypothetical protein [Caudoviricetes sp.]
MAGNPHEYWCKVGRMAFAYFLGSSQKAAGILWITLWITKLD